MDDYVVLSSLIWAIAAVIITAMVIGYLVKKAIIEEDLRKAALTHEITLKEKTSDIEKYWYFQKELKKDYQKELNEKIQKLKDEKKKLEDDLDKEKKNKSEELAKERMKAERDFYEKILKMFYKADDSQQTKKL